MLGGVTCEELGHHAVEELPVRSWDVMLGGVTCEELGRDVLKVLPVRNWDVMLWSCYL